MTLTGRVKAWLNPEPKNPARRVTLSGPAVRDVLTLMRASGSGTKAPEVLERLARDEVERRGL